MRFAAEAAVKRRLRQEFFDARDAGELDFGEIVASTGPRRADGSLPRDGRSTSLLPPGTADG
ncbi:type II toxin-antitoxin system VapB family antitoxin [Streptomyces sp. RFCAC02]|uniref:type II toxin-antitoxin system VapB family antitoxin n=1 Tax=Streptomyces sp. RFCAC02 TaxID=2499143 RepID=UPI001F0E77BD|nr:type II toxin-antitoxin system VapB family antitoxin [Streptomyces sp. RFCAC02]